MGGSPLLVCAMGGEVPPWLFWGCQSGEDPVHRPVTGLPPRKLFEHSCRTSTGGSRRPGKVGLRQGVQRPVVIGGLEDSAESFTVQRRGIGVKDIDAGPTDLRPEPRDRA